MRRVALLSVAAFALVGAPGAAVAASPTLRASIVHTLRGCHAFSVSGKPELPAASVTVARGTRLALRVTCPMEFDLTQVRGPALAFGAPRFQAGTTRTIVFRKPGVYKLRAKNVQTSEEVGLQTLGPDNVPTLTVVVR